MRFEQKRLIMVQSLTTISHCMNIHILLVAVFGITLFSCPSVFSELQNEKTPQQPSANMTNSSSSINVSIVQGASALTDKAYQPNPVIIKVGNAIVWINHDSAVHTVTEGNPASDVSQNGFDSGLLTPGQMFRHSFDKQAVVEYHCSLHPTMLGKIIVNNN
jgi:plastocyanin